MKTKTLAVNGLVAALYIAVTLLIAPIAFGSIQYRVSELFNHLVVFNKKYIYGIVVGVFLANLFLSTMKLYDLTFGVAHSIICLAITIGVSKYVKNEVTRMIINTLVFTFNMFIIAYALHLALDLPFLVTWATTAIGEFVVMAIGIPIMYILNKRISFGKLVD
ncbi:QueT transporter family protein [Bacillus sp. B1-b2]|uniref:QueT transporter family protein n=1 Tax=Bacillus sp. B1-b2 TaxID=2653201 RepID=UPI0012625A54|nr:QueT transporter family protein [Bacillus sp. B1-b2]KAB7664881.1 QueT transporter family protein [Bacillus sp. B1-b2]